VRSAALWRKPSRRFTQVPPKASFIDRESRESVSYEDSPLRRHPIPFNFLISHCSRRLAVIVAAVSIMFSYYNTDIGKLWVAPPQRPGTLGRGHLYQATCPRSVMDLSDDLRSYLRAMIALRTIVPSVSCLVKQAPRPTDCWNL
jgi:hypothetical protein